MTKVAKISCKAFSYGVIPDPFLNLSSSEKEQIQDIDGLKKYMFGGNIFLHDGGYIWIKPLIEFTNLAKISCEAFSYGVIPDPFLHLRSSKMEQMKGIDPVKKEMPGSNIFICVDGRCSKKTTHLLD